MRSVETEDSSDMSTNTVRLDPSDNVVTALKALETGAAVEETTTLGLVPRGHKIATRAIPAGTPVIKYAQIIGYAAEDIAPGS
ncbi:MAG: UxaA family hydrolase, partial [Candidatus Marinimicrobia bacterium]|nr:UxaA family hydrolase [Candidatus Neomarinimicrobiota bacterium]